MPHRMGSAAVLPGRNCRMGRGLALLAFWLAACSLATTLSADQQSPGPLEVLQQLNSVTLDPAQVYAIRDAHITRGRMNLYLNRGFIIFMKPVMGEVTGAVFSGEGEVLMIPPDRAEKRNLAQFTQAPILEEKVDSIYMRFSDQTAQELLAASHRPDPDDPEQPPPLAEGGAAIPLNPETSVRILTDLVGDRSHPYFYAHMNGEELGVFDVIDDERLEEPFSIGAMRKAGPQTFTDVWCSFPTHSLPSGSAAPLDVTVRPLAYNLDVHIHPDRTLEGRAEIQLESRSAQDRVISFELSRWLAVTEVEDDRGSKLIVIGGQPEAEDPGAARAYDHVDVVLPHAYPVGARFRLTFKYHGDVIADVGNGVLYVGARGSWYPNIDIGVPSTYDMTFHYPRKLVLVATGERIEEKASEDGGSLSRWRSDGVFRMAGFNLGPYNSVERHAGKTSVAIYATPAAESALEKRHDAQHPQSLFIPSRHPIVVAPPSLEPVPLSPAALLGEVADIAAQAVQYYSSLFGPYPYPRLAISQVPGSAGQGWPELVYLPTLSFLPKTERTELDSNRGDLLGPGMIAHEIAHQWWGNLVGWQTYHDQWLSEGLATYAAALFLARSKDGSRQFRDLLQIYKGDLLAKTSEGSTVESGGPIWLGQRLSSSRDPQGYSNIVYKKACWVLHMLRGLMTDPKTDSDARFFRMLRDFVARYQGQAVSTGDFVHLAEKYMTPASDLENNHKLDWFFEEWVYDTGIPAYSFKTEVRSLASGQCVVQGTISQSDVSKDFEMPVRLVACYPRGKRATLGRVVVGANEAHFKFTAPQKPLRVMIDEEDLLAVVR
ncbi:MAG: M1 family metallopeptidase [Terriglobia bacterium]